MHVPLVHGICVVQEMLLPLLSMYGFCPELLRSMPTNVAFLPTTCSGSNGPSTLAGSSTARLENASHMPLLSTTNWLNLVQLSRVFWMLGSLFGLGGFGSQMVPVYFTVDAVDPSILGMLVRSANDSATGAGG